MNTPSSLAPREFRKLLRSIAVAIANQMTGSFAPREGFGHLPRDPFRGRIAGHRDPEVYVVN
jgi:hypothetical protein